MEVFIPGALSYALYAKAGALTIISYLKKIPSLISVGQRWIKMLRHTGKVQ